MGPLHHHFTSSCPHSVGLAHWAPGHAHLKIFAFPGFFFLEYSSPDVGRAPSLQQWCAQRLSAQEALSFPPHHPYSFHQPSLVFFPHRGMTIWHPVYYTHSGFYLWSFPLLSVAPRGSRFQFFCSLLYSVSRVGPGTRLVLNTYFWMNEWNSIFYIQEEMEWGWTGGGKWKAANPDGLHTQSLETRQRLPERRTFSKTEERESQPTVVFEFAQASGEGFLEEFFSASESSSCPKSSSSWGGGECLPAARYWSRDSQASLPASPEVGARGPQAQILTPAGSRVPGCLLRSRLCNFSCGDVESQCLWSHVENPELFSSSSPASQALSLLLHSRLYPTATVPHGERQFLQLLSPQQVINSTRQSVTVSDDLCYSDHSC